MDVANSKTLRNFTILNKALLFFIKLNKTAMQSVPNSTLVLRLIQTFAWKTLVICSAKGYLMTAMRKNEKDGGSYSAVSIN